MFRQLSYWLSLWLLLPAGLWASDVKTPVQASLNQLSPEQQRKFDYFYYEAANLKNAGKYDAAYDLFSYCLSLDTASSPVLYELAMFQLQRNRPEKAVEMLKSAVAHSDDNFTYRMTLAGLYRNLGMYGEASDSYEELVKRYPDKSELNYYLADALTQEGEIGAAIDAYNVLESTMGMNETLSLQKFKLYQTLKQPDKAF
ncbi:MAG: tetratricopeptide repeat protein, partial [Parabacteroides sp.]|nr:tetratricopeptide repeat protein [Parabacteroides sp.]